MTNDMIPIPGLNRFKTKMPHVALLCRHKLFKPAILCIVKRLVCIDLPFSVLVFYIYIYLKKVLHPSLCALLGAAVTCEFPPGGVDKVHLSLF